MKKTLDFLALGLLGFLVFTTFSGASFNAKEVAAVEMRDFVSFEKELKPVFKQHCAQCHENKGLVDVTIYPVAYSLKDDIVNRVYYNRSMPKHGPFLKESDRELVKLWSDTGAKK